MTRSLIFAGTVEATPSFPLDPTPLALDLDPWSATAAQLALVLADVREDATTDGEGDRAVLSHLRATLRADDVQGALDPDGQLARAYVAVLTPAARP